MIWPPVKAWTSNLIIDGQLHFVAINYGGKSKDRWVDLMSVLDSSVVVKVSWLQLIDPLNWECGWKENINLNESQLVNNEGEIRIIKSQNPSIDSGLTIPITKSIIRPWIAEI